MKYTVDQLQEILKNHREWVTTSGGIRADLRGADLSRAYLIDADLSDANLRGADFRGADFRGADLSRADLSDADLSDADLSDADLSDADLSRAYLIDADLSDANLRGADLSGANLRGADLSGADLSYTNLSGVKNLLKPIEFLKNNFVKTDAGIIVYKSFGEHHDPNPNWKIEDGSIIEEVVNPIPTACGSGVNVATKDWVDKNCDNQVWECLVKWEWLPGVVVPYQTDGKIRASKVQLIRKL